VIGLQTLDTTGKNVPIFDVEELSVPLFICKLLRVVQRVAYLEKPAIVEHVILLIFHGRWFRDVDEVF
jgi:hypothetical protein